MKNNIIKKDINIESTHILLKSDLDVDVRELIIEKREIISKAINDNSDFLGYKPIEVIHDNDILELMTNAAIISDTGPMSSVAGSISQVVLEYLLSRNSKYSIIENGGDIALKINRKTIIGIEAASSIFSYNLGFKIKPKPHTLGICTSASTGHSTSFGKSDATIVFSRNASISDALATRIGNSAIGDTDEEIVNNSLETAEEYSEYYDGVVVIKNDSIGKTGQIPSIVSIDDK